MSTPNTAGMVPFVKWAGGKRQMLEQLTLRMPEKYGTYYEPFVGGGALALYLEPRRAFLNDINRELVHTYTEIRDHLDTLLVLLDSMDKVTCTKEYYYEMRSRYNEKLRLGDYDPEMAALFIYLNKHCFNGLYRVNTQGEFNVPWNQKQLVRSMDMENIKRISAFLKSVTLTCQDFEAALEGIQEGDFVYFDSPYAPLNPTSFDSYTKEGFAEEEHRRLAGLFRRLAEKGVYCMLTNHNTELIRELYDGFLIEEIDVRRAINSDPKKIKIPEMEKQMLSEIAPKMVEQYGIEVVSASIKAIGVPEKPAKAIADRMISERKKAAAVYKQQGNVLSKEIKTKADAQKRDALTLAEAKATKLRAEGDAAAAANYAVFRQDPELAVFLRKLESMKRLMGKRTTLVLDTNSAPFDILKYGGSSLGTPAGEKSK